MLHRLRRLILLYVKMVKTVNFMILKWLRRLILLYVKMVKTVNFVVRLIKHHAIKMQAYEGVGGVGGRSSTYSGHLVPRGDKR